MSKNKLLQIYFDAGIDEVISENPINRFLQKEEAKQVNPITLENNFEEKVEIKIINKDANKDANKDDSLTQNISTFAAIAKLAARSSNLANNMTNEINMTNQPLVSIKEIIKTAQDAANSCKTLKELEKAVCDFDGCSLKKMATNTVFADGDPESPIMIIGEAPGNHEDLQGIPFCGDSGKLLNEMFKAIGYKRENLYITNTLFWRPPGNRRPTEDELAMCKPFVEKHIALLKPKLIVLMGATAMVDVLGINDPISKVRGKFYDYKNDLLKEPISATTLFHPSYLMRQSSKKRDAWSDLLMIKEFLKQ